MHGFAERAHVGSPHEELKWLPVTDVLAEVQETPSNYIYVYKYKYKYPHCPDASLTSISGADVPKPKISSPIMSGEILKILATLAPLSVNASALHIRRQKPIKRDKIDRNILMKRII